MVVSSTIMSTPEQSTYSAHQRRRVSSDLTMGQPVYLRGTDEIVLVQAADGVRLEADAAIAPATFEIRVMVFDVCDVRHRVDEAHGTVEIRELEFLAQRLAVFHELPARQQAAQHLLRLIRRQRAHAAMAGHAFLVDQGVVVAADLCVHEMTSGVEAVASMRA